MGVVRKGNVYAGFELDSLERSDTAGEKHVKIQSQLLT